MGAEEITSYNKNDPDNAMILAQENAGNIQVIKKQLEKFLDLDKQVNTMNNDLDKLAVQVNGIIMN
jgi:K+/H+ antiporter YhaU regulatory subunit KhtT